MNDNAQYNFDITVVTNYLEQDSAPQDNHYVFSYTITIRNMSSIAAKLLTRHWLITDADGNTQEVKGNGVIGQQPHIKPGEEFTYTSGTYLETPLGFMEGSYHMLTDDETYFDATVPTFRLAIPYMLN